MIDNTDNKCPPDKQHSDCVRASLSQLVSSVEEEEDSRKRKAKNGQICAEMMGATEKRGRSLEGEGRVIGTRRPDERRRGVSITAPIITLLSLIAPLFPRDPTFEKIDGTKERWWPPG